MASASRKKRRTSQNITSIASGSGSDSSGTAPKKTSDQTLLDLFNRAAGSEARTQAGAAAKTFLSANSGGGSGLAAANPAGGGGSGRGDVPVAEQLAQTPFGKLFDTGMYESAYQNPEAVIREWFRARGLPVEGGLETVLQQMQPQLGIQYEVNNDLNGGGGYGSSGGYLDYVGRLLDQATSGSQGMSAPTFLQGLLNPHGSTLRTQLQTGSAADQVSNTLSGMRYGLVGKVPTPVLNAMLTEADSVGKDYQARMLTNPRQTTNPFDELLRARTHWAT